MAKDREAEVLEIVSWKQLQISMQVAFSPATAQGQEYEKRCQDGFKLNPSLCPMARSSSYIHFKIQKALSEVYFDLDRKALKTGVRCMGLAEDWPYSGLVFQH